MIININQLNYNIMNIVTALKAATHSYSKPIMGGRELITFSEYKLIVKNEYERNHLETINKQREAMGYKPAFYKRDNEMYYSVVHKGQAIPEQLDFTLILVQPFGVTQNSFRITKHFA